MICIFEPFYPSLRKKMPGCDINIMVRMLFLIILHYMCIWITLYVYMYTILVYETTVEKYFSWNLLILLLSDHAFPQNRILIANNWPLSGCSYHQGYKWQAYTLLQLITLPQTVFHFMGTCKPVWVECFWFYSLWIGTVNPQSGNLWKHGHSSSWNLSSTGF